MTISNFKQVSLSGMDAKKFLQGQVTIDVSDLIATHDTDNKNAINNYQAAAICCLKGRIQFGLWIQSENADTFNIVTHTDCIAEFLLHIKKYGAFSKMTLGNAIDVYPCIIDGNATFTDDIAKHDEANWQAVSIATGNYWITDQSQSLFQPQEIRLHQRGGVSYTKGCYIGQEVVARIYFRSAPKSCLYRIAAEGNVPSIGEKIGENKKVHIINAIVTETGFEALVIARENHLVGFTQLPLPLAMQEDVARKTL